MAEGVGHSSGQVLKGWGGVHPRASRVTLTGGPEVWEELNNHEQSPLQS